MVSNTRKLIENYLCNGGEDAALRGLVPVKEGAGDKANEPHCHDSCRDAEADIHAGISLNPNKEGKGN